MLSSMWKILVWMGLSLFAVPVSLAQVGAGAAVFQTLNLSPESIALGEATIGVRGYPGAAQLNPAGVGRQNIIQIGSNLDGGLRFTTPWLEELFSGYWVANPSVEFKRNKWAFAYSYKRFDFGTVAFRDAQNNPIRDDASFDASHKLVAAYDVLDNLAIGLAFNTIRMHRGGRVEGSTSNMRTIAFDLGVLFEKPIRTPAFMIYPSAGWSLTDFGPQFELKNTAGEVFQRDALSMRMRGGVAVRVATRQTVWGLPAFSAGLFGSLTKPLIHLNDRNETAGPFTALFSAWQPIEVITNTSEGTAETLTVWDQTTRHGGVELSFANIFDIRWGSHHEHELMGGRQHGSMGWGIDLYFLALDRATIRNTDGPFKDMEYWKLTARVPLEKTRDNFWPDMFIWLEEVIRNIGIKIRGR